MKKFFTLAVMALLSFPAISVFAQDEAETEEPQQNWVVTLKRTDVSPNEVTQYNLESEDGSVWSCVTDELVGGGKYNFSIADGVNTAKGSNFTMPEDGYVTFGGYVPTGKNYIVALCSAVEYRIGDHKYTVLHRVMPGANQEQHVAYFNSSRVSDIKVLENGIKAVEGREFDFVTASKNTIHFFTPAKSFSGICKATADYKTASITIEKADEVTVKVGNIWAETMVLPVAAEIPAGVEVYTLKLNDKNELDPVLLAGNVVPANTPVVVKGAPGEYSFKFVEGEQEVYEVEEHQPGVRDTQVFMKDVSATEENHLTGAMQIHKLPLNAYTLQNVDGNATFVKNEDATTLVNPLQSYVMLPEAEEIPATLPVNFVVLPTGVENIAVDGGAADSAIYNVWGMRVDSSYKGIVIRDGKKYIQR